MSQRLKALRNRAKLSVRETAEAIGRPTSTYQNYEDAFKKPYLPVELVRDLAPVFEARGIDPHEVWLLAGVSKGVVEIDAPTRAIRRAASIEREVVSIRGTEYVSLPVYDLRLSAGPGAWADGDGEPAHYEAFRHDWIRSLTNSALDLLMLASVGGDSMADTLHDGDQVLIDRGRSRPGIDGIYGLRWGDELLVKRISVDPRNGLLTVGSDNQRYRSYDGVDPNDIAVIGRVRWIGRRV